ncbi:hypothetical protein EPUS_04646 [Endocarpon pusillum Z07020]|uniref:C3H1-type domain-containing protein n=1 Tax=Endocarpon pusillum (strain Z07020 / HMAS-L-300199) TaxID=1263415 RepID=U1G983_ENDPU|nr:uncharacterized protein EPUS_04646 [Endocarpon pusillum Z07020]ERF68548.1 hypothetical protein EPUS_04646 [Endocarpon pusillum Z07020]
MTEEEDLLAKIGELAGQINRRKQPNAPQHTLNQSSGYHPRPSFPYSPRSIPYVRGRGQTFQNRSLIANNRAKPVQASSAPSISPPDQIEIPRAENLNPMPRGIAKYGRGARAWISEDALRQQLERQKYHSNSLQATGEDSVIHQSVTSGSDTPTPSTAYITVADIPFQVTNGGSKLLRTTDTSTLTKPTPKEAVVSGVIFKRSKNGNLVRAAVAHQGRTPQIGKAKLCRQYTSTGRCSRGDKCFGIHDAARTAICPSVLRGIDCPAGEDCDLSHESSSKVAPTCLHFLRGMCTKHFCPYSHAPVDPSAPLCRGFSYLGYCEKGSACGQRHLRECPDYSSGSGCRLKHCPLPHVDRASQMRRNGANNPGNTKRMEVDDDTSDEETQDLDSDNFEEPEELFRSSTFEFPQQQDFVGLT